MKIRTASISHFDIIIIIAKITEYIKIAYLCFIKKHYSLMVRSLSSIPNQSHILLFWNRWLKIRISKWGSLLPNLEVKWELRCTHAWLLIRTCLQLVLFVDRSDLLCLSSDINYSLEQGKSRAIVEVKDKKPSTKKKKKLKTNSHTRKNREKKMMLNFRIRNLAISRRNG